MGQGPTIKIYGLDRAIGAMEQLEPGFRREARKEIMRTPKKVAEKARSQARGIQPLSGWGKWRETKRGRDLSWDGGEVASGIRAIPGGRRLNVRLVSKSAAGSIFEQMGSGEYVGQSNPARRGQGAAMVKAISRRYGNEPRLLRKTWKDERGITRFAADLNRVVRRLSSEIEQKINR